MTHAVRFKKFEGPLDLLLQLIEEEKMSITDVTLSKITEQFLAYLDNMTVGRSENLADFLMVATRLVYLKSRQILPSLQPDEDEGPALAEQLKLYRQFIEASRRMNILWQQRSVSYGRMEPPIKAVGFVPPANADAKDIYNAMVVLVRRLQPLRPLAQMRVDKTVSIRQKINSLRQLIAGVKKMNFSNMMRSAGSRTESIVSFLALLELVREEIIRIRQSGAYADLILEKN